MVRKLYPHWRVLRGLLRRGLQLVSPVSPSPALERGLAHTSDTGEAIRHGSVAVLEAVANWLPTKTYRRVRKYLAEKGIGVNWVAVHQQPQS